MVQTAKPQWIAEMFPPSTGRDHLGLGSVSSDQILPSLSPGINVLTIHPRYCSFFVFLLDEFWKRDRLRSSSAWTAFFRPRAFVFSLGAHLCDRHDQDAMGNIVGSRKTASLARATLQSYDSTTHYIDSPLGGYGLYYRSVMAELGLVYPGGPGLPYPVDVPSEDGKALSRAFRQAVEKTTYYTEYFRYDQVNIPRGVIIEYIREACLCRLETPICPDRPLLLDTYLHAGVNATARRDTLRMLLDIGDQTDGYSVDEDCYRQLIYYRAADSGASYQPREDLRETSRRWRLYQAREYYGFALNTLWAYVCAWGLDQKGDLRPVDLADIRQEVKAALDFNQLAARFGVPFPAIDADSDLRGLLKWLKMHAGIGEPALDGVWNVRAPIQEHSLMRLVQSNRASMPPDIYVAGMIVMLLLVYLRLADPVIWTDPAWEVSHMGSDGRLSVAGFLSSLEQRLNRGPYSVSECASWVLDDYIILQHQLVATSKLPDNTFRFQREGDRLRFFSHDNPLGFQDSRFRALSTTVHDLGLCGDLAQHAHPLSADGKRLLAERDLL